MVVSESEAPPLGHLLQALLVYAEPLCAGARVVVLGDEPQVEERLRDFGARHVHLTGALDALDFRDGAFDLAIMADLGVLDDPDAAVRKLRRVVSPGGAVVALARARTDVDVREPGGRGLFPEVAPAAVGYAELYDLFAMQFENVTMSGVLPFEGIVFAQLGMDDDVAVAVDAQLAPPPPPSVFVVVASRDPVDLDPYSIVQIPSTVADGTREEAAEAALAAAMLESQLLSAQLEEQLVRNSGLAARTGSSDEGVQSARERDVALVRLAEIAHERDIALTRAAELEAVLVAAQQALANLERRLVITEQAILERDDALVALRGELDAVRGEGEGLDSVAPELVAQLTARVEHAEAALALNVADLAHVAEAHASETKALEGQLRERAGVVAAMERELARREHLVRELVGTLEEARESGADPLQFESAPAQAAADGEEIVRLTRKVDELALEVARREGELVAQTWRIEELENDRAPRDKTASPPSAVPDEGRERELAKARDEIDALRQALTQEHAARLSAESGEELARARAELARQATLLEQMKARGSHPSD